MKIEIINNDYDAYLIVKEEKIYSERVVNINSLQGSSGVAKITEVRDMNMDALKDRDYYLLIDKSGSMDDKDCAGGMSRWKSCEESTIAIANKIHEFDSDGITVVPFSSVHKIYDNVTPNTVKNIFTENSPMGGTNLAEPLQAIFNDYLKKKAAGKAKPNGALALVVTDGLPQDDAQVATAIINFTKKLEKREEFGISFLQIGKDQGASKYLKGLDNDLQKQGAKLDIVNTKTFEELETVGLTQALFAALSE